MGSPYPLHYTLRWPFYYMRPSIKNHSGLGIKPIEYDFFPEAKEFVRLNFCGDIMITQKDTIPILHPELCNLLNSSDFLIGNCEAPVGLQPLNPMAKYGLIYHMPKFFLSGIMDQLALKPNQWVLSVANNHSGDKGKNAFFESVNILHEMGVTPVGHFMRSELPLVVLEWNGLKIGVVSWTDWMNCEVFSSEQGAARLKNIENINWDLVKKSYQLDSLIGLPHWEYEFQHFPKMKTRHLAKKLIDQMGFNLILGAHPHTLQPLEWFQQGMCLYSIGNFCGLGMAWPVRLIPILEVKMGLKENYKGKIVGYKLHYFAQINEDNSMKIVPLHEATERLRDKLPKRLELVFQC